ncbi:MAG: KH domain-containing protein [Candidatus Aenigmarchaeota archaeon]|nr:KH domain-containing protein [Candidatus Aenigmarchaeota archaeon]
MEGYEENDVTPAQPMDPNSVLVANNKALVTPGELIAKGVDFLPGGGTYKDAGEVRSKLLGIVRLRNDHLVSVVPLSGQYMPFSGDGVIGVVADVQISSWMVDVNAPYIAFLSLSEGVDEYVDLQKSDLTHYFDVGDVVYAKVLSVSKRKDVKLTMRDRVCRKLHGGNIMTITPAKVPRLIGKGGSMIELIKQHTGCHIIVGQNGLVWMKGEKEALAAEAVMMVERESHIDGLTDRITSFLTSQQG